MRRNVRRVKFCASAAITFPPPRANPDPPENGPTGSDKTNTRSKSRPKARQAYELPTNCLRTAYELRTKCLRAPNDPPTSTLREAGEQPKRVLREACEKPAIILRKASEKPTRNLREACEEPARAREEPARRTREAKKDKAEKSGPTPEGRTRRAGRREGVAQSAEKESAATAAHTKAQGHKGPPTPPRDAALPPGASPRGPAG